LSQVDDLQANPPVRRITHRHYTCIFCGNCEANCTTQKGIKLSDKWDLAGLDKEAMVETHEFELQLCEKCGALIGTKKHLVWLYEKLGPLAYTNPSLLLAKSGELSTKPVPSKVEGPKEVQPQPDKLVPSPTTSLRVNSVEGAVQTNDFMRILCPKCKCELNIHL
jgi:ferredoxin